MLDSGRFVFTDVGSLDVRPRDRQVTMVMMVVMTAALGVTVAVMVMMVADFDLNLGHFQLFAGRFANPCSVIGIELRERIRNRR
jgi:hypothetical protein